MCTLSDCNSEAKKLKLYASVCGCKWVLESITISFSLIFGFYYCTLCLFYPSTVAITFHYII